MAITLIILLLVIQIKGQHPSFEDFNTKEDYHEPEKEVNTEIIRYRPYLVI